MSGFAISWSRLDCHEKCARQSYWKNFAPKDMRLPYDQTSPHLIKGRLWHKWMEDACLDRAELPAEVLRFKPMVDAIKRAPGELLIEHKVTLTEKLQKCDWFSSLAYWRTIFDLLKIPPSGQAISLDWKTGKPKSGTDQLKFSSAKAFLRWPKINRIKTAYVWLEYPDQPLTSVEYYRTDLKDIMADFRERVEMVKICYEENTWEPSPSDFNCKWCQCSKEQCKYSRTGK